MRHITLGTAGHVDHGKTALVRALTGIDTDRLKEEKERGITIELGFAHLLLPDGIMVGIVDVPGHERFVKHMVAGATGIDCVALIIAADEGIMPQTREHLAICSLLGVTTGLIALTKIDLVDREWLDLVSEDIRDFVAGTFLEGAPIIPLSSVTGEGLETFMHALAERVATIAAREDAGIFRLPIDRIFTMKGFGTIVTGTVTSGHLSVGDEVVIMPAGKRGRVRGMQHHGKAVDTVSRGQRAAANIQGVAKDEVPRGSVLSLPDTLIPSHRLDAFLTMLPVTAGTLKNRQLVRLHVGTDELTARMVIIGHETVPAGKSAYVQLFVEKPLAVVAGDRFVIRSYSPMTTIGGGLILDPLPRKYKRSYTTYEEELVSLHHGPLQERMRTVLNRSGWVGAQPREIILRTGTAYGQIRPALEEMCARNEVAIVEDDEHRMVSGEIYCRLKERIGKQIADYHEQHPLKEGIPREALRQMVGGYISARLFTQALLELEHEGAIVVEKEWVRAAQHRVTFGNLERLRADVEKKYRVAGLTPPSRREILAEFGSTKEVEAVLDMLLKEGVLVKVSEDLYFHHEPLSRLEEDYRALLLREDKATPVTFKELTGLTRKFVIPLMEYFDARKLTLRMGDYRILRTKL